MNSNRMHSLLVILTAVAAFCVTPAAAADEALTIDVLAIRATNSNETVSPELRPHIDRLKKLGFKGFKLEKRESGRVEIGKSLAAPLIENAKVTVTPVKREGRRIELRIELAQGEKKILNTSVTINAGDSQIISGPKLANGDTLVIAVSGR